MKLSSVPIKIFRQKLSAGEAGVAETLGAMRRLVQQGKKNINVRLTALQLVEGLPQKDFVGEVRALHRFVRDRMRYVKDISGVETLHTPERLLEIGQGDCDDKSVLLASLLESLGHPTRFAAIGFLPGHFSHVLVETKLGKKWLPLETTEPVELGWYPKGVKSRLTIKN